MITKAKLKDVIDEWISALCQEFENECGDRNSGSSGNLLWWHLAYGSYTRRWYISACLCYDNNKQHTGYIIYLNSDVDNPVIKIEGNNLVDCISNDNIHNFKKEWIYDLINRIKQVMG